MALTDKLTAIGNAIREKTGETELLTLDEMPNKISGISGGIDEGELVTFNQQNSQLTAYLAEADAQYTNANYNSVSVAASYVGTYDDPLGYQLTLKSAGTIYFFDENDSQQSWSETVSAGAYTVYDLIPNHVYRWTLVSNGESVQMGRITSTGKVRMIYDAYAETGSTDNIRDLGGWACDGGAVRYGILYRGQIPTALTVQTKNKLKALGIKTQIDMYAEGERKLWDGINYRQYKLADMGGATNIKLDGTNYKTAAAAMKEAVNSAIKQSPTYINCWSGADRTGTLSWMLLALLGVSEADCDKDYEITSLAGRNNRLRTVNKGLPDYLLTLGSSVRDGVVGWCQKVGITETDVNAYRQAMSTGTPTIITYTWAVSNNLTNVSTNNSTTTAKGSYTATLSPASGYDLGVVKVTMGGTDVTSSAYANGKVTISKVTGDVVITASGNKQAVAYTNVLTKVNAGKYASEPLGSLGTDASYWASNVIKWDKPRSVPMYIRGWTYNTSASHSRIYGSDTSNGGINSTYGYTSGSRLTNNYKVETLTTGYVKLTAITGADTTRYVCISMPGNGSGVIITIGEPIE